MLCLRWVNRDQGHHRPDGRIGRKVLPPGPARRCRFLAAQGQGNGAKIRRSGQNGVKVIDKFADSGKGERQNKILIGREEASQNGPWRGN
ncbi:protein of unknown function [Magnetospirillum sp. XM-1]|nr:protein of unknown function [Magnetospirillum sp. XM-1]